MCKNRFFAIFEIAKNVFLHFWKCQKMCFCTFGNVKKLIMYFWKWTFFGILTHCVMMKMLVEDVVVWNHYLIRWFHYSKCWYMYQNHRTQSRRSSSREFLVMRERDDPVRTRLVAWCSKHILRPLLYDINVDEIWIHIEKRLNPKGSTSYYTRDN